MFNPQELSSLICSSIGDIMGNWAKAVRNALPSTSSLDDENLFNGLPEFLDNLAKYFVVPKNSTEWQRVVQETSEIAKKHGKQRASQPGFSLDQVIAEHQILRRILFQFIQNRFHLDLEQWNTILECVDKGISEAATVFALDRGFKDARYHKLEKAKIDIEVERNRAYSDIDQLKIQREMREQFVSTLSHDLRTPITSAKTAAELIAHSPESSGQVARLAFRIIDDLSRSDRMIRDLLDANRIRSGQKLSLEVQETKILELVKTTIANLTRVYGDRFTLNADHEVVGYWSGKDLERTIENLAINGVKYGAPDTPIDIQVTDQGEKITISVHNSGSLITPSEQEALFQPFSRIKNLDTKGKKGWGLELTLVFGITEAYGGTVQVKSEADRGTTFTITLPKDARDLKDQTSSQIRAS